MDHPSPFLPPHPCWSLQPTPGSAFPLNSAGIHNLAPHIGDSRRVPSKAQAVSAGETQRRQTAPCKTRGGEVGRRDRSLGQGPRRQWDGFMFRQLSLLLQGLHENLHVSAELGWEPHVFPCPLPATLAFLERFQDLKISIYLFIFYIYIFIYHSIYLFLNFYSSF